MRVLWERMLAIARDLCASVAHCVGHVARATTAHCSGSTAPQHCPRCAALPRRRIPQAKAALGGGMWVVIGLQSTGEL
jgi:hypothetical protein